MVLLRHPTAVLALISSLLLSPAVQAASLESVLADQANLTMFRGLVKNTIQATLKYHILKGTIDMPSIVKGDSIWAATTLTDRNYSTVTGGQHLILTKQPGGEVVLTSGFATRGTVVVEDLQFDSGLVQIIDSVMHVPETLESTARNAYKDLAAFVGALYATDLYDEVAGWEDVTIFVPRNAAFQQLAGTFAAMDRQDLRRVLRYHVVPGRLSHVWELRNASALASADGGTEVAITRQANSIFVNSAEIIQPDILLANGVAHLIDNVLDPGQPDARPDFSLTTQQPPVFTPLGTATATGANVPTPFVSNLPCTPSCVGGTRATAAPTGSGGADSSNAGGALPRCTGLAGAGLGIGLVVGAIMAGF
ncbi:Fasciclin-domain-containing protein [Thermothelomyces heterothallicus CBS 203.75]